MKNIIKSFLFSLLILAGYSGARAQDATDSSLQKWVESRQFVFKAQTAMPLRGTMRTLTSEYDMQVRGDSLITYLPYFGRAYVAPINPAENGLNFTSTDFSYTSKKKKDGWEIAILPKDNRDVKELYLSISSEGYAHLQVVSNNRDAISFNGYVDHLKK